MIDNVTIIILHADSQRSVALSRMSSGVSGGHSFDREFSFGE